jgi:flagellar FliJ protein
VKKFRFRLQTLLDQRKSTEEMLQAELGKLLYEELVELERLGELKVRLEQAWQHFETLSQDPHTTAEAFEVCDRWSKTLRDDIKVQMLTIEAVRKRIDEKRAEVAEAMKQRKVIETLRDHQEHEYVVAQARAEQNALDDIASLAYARRA